MRLRRTLTSLALVAGVVASPQAVPAQATTPSGVSTVAAAQPSSDVSILAANSGASTEGKEAGQWIGYIFAAIGIATAASVIFGILRTFSFQLSQS